MITICVGIKNRTVNLIQCLLVSMNECEQKESLALSIFDCNTDDVENLEKEIRKCWGGELIFKSEAIEFTRTYTLNKAVEAAATEKIFVCDADMTLPVNFIKQYNENVNGNTVWFPVCFSLYAFMPKEIKVNETGWWRHSGRGMMGLLKNNFIKIGQYNLDYKEWGREDDDFFARTKKANFKIVRDQCKGLFHNWHEQGVWHK